MLAKRKINQVEVKVYEQNKVQITRSSDIKSIRYLNSGKRQSLINMYNIGRNTIRKNYSYYVTASKLAKLVIV